jgi:hypothetical protein
VRCRGLCRRVLEGPNGWGVVKFHRSDKHFGRARRGTGDVAGDALLQEKLGALDHRLAVEPVSQAAILQSIGNGRDRHALMVRHETADDCPRFAGW